MFLIIRNYNSSRVLPICLVLLDSQTYKHERKDLFGLQLYCSQVLGHSFMEINELSGYDILKEEIEKDNTFTTKQLDVYLYQSEFHKKESIKEIVEYCLSCRVPFTIQCNDV